MTACTAIFANTRRERTRTGARQECALRSHQIQYLPVKHVEGEDIRIANPRLNDSFGRAALQRCKCRA